MNTENNPLMIHNSIFEAAWIEPTSILIVGMVIGLLIGFFSLQKVRKEYTKNLEDLVKDIQEGL